MNDGKDDILQPSDKIEDRPLDPENAYKIPLPMITKGMKPTQVKRRSYQFLICIPVFFFLFTSALCGLQIYIVLSPNVQEFAAIKSVINNIIDADCKKFPIYALKLVSSNEACPEGYEEEQFGTFAGTLPGCYDIQRSTVDSSKCSSSEQYKSVEPLSAAPFMFWRDYGLCTKRLKELTFAEKSSDCAAKTKACKYYPFYICVGEDEDCPISDIKTQPSQKNVPRTYKAGPFGDSQQLIYSNDPGIPQSLTGFLVTLNNLPCLDPTEAPSRRTRQGTEFSYPLMVREENGCSDFGTDYDTQKIDSYSESGIYYENGLSQVFQLPLLSEFAIANNLTLNAQYTKSVKNKPICQVCQTNTHKELKKISEELWETNQFYVIFSKLGVILIIVMLATACYNFYSYCMVYKDLELMYLGVLKVNMCVFSYMLGHFITAGVLTMLNYRQISNTIHALDEFVDAKCFNNDNVNQAMNELHKDVLATALEMTVDSGTILIIAIIANVIVVIADYILGGIKKGSGARHEEAQPLKVGEVELERKNRNHQDPADAEL